MRSVATGLGFSALMLVVAIEGGAQERTAPAKGDAATASTTDPRYTLKGGLHDAGEAAKNMERIASLPKPDGFFDPSKPAGNPSPPETPPPPAGEAAAPRTPPPFDPVVANRLSFTKWSTIGAFVTDHYTVDRATFNRGLR